MIKKIKRPEIGCNGALPPSHTLRISPNIAKRMRGDYIPFCFMLPDIISGHAIALNYYYFIVLIKLIGGVVPTTLALLRLLIALVFSLLFGFGTPWFYSNNQAI